jgi:hypothetical protein
METLKQILTFIANYENELVYIIKGGIILIVLNTVYLLYKLTITRKDINKTKEITLKNEKVQTFLNSCNNSLKRYKFFSIPILIPLLFYATIIISGIIIKGKLVLSISFTILTIIAIAMIILVSFISTNIKLKKEDIF